jgi:hypothetical protein
MRSEASFSGGVGAAVASERSRAFERAGSKVVRWISDASSEFRELFCGRPRDGQTSQDARFQWSKREKNQSVNAMRLTK